MAKDKVFGSLQIPFVRKTLLFGANSHRIRTSISRVLVWQSRKMTEILLLGSWKKSYCWGRFTGCISTTPHHKSSDKRSPTTNHQTGGLHEYRPNQYQPLWRMSSLSEGFSRRLYFQRVGRPILKMEFTQWNMCRRFEDGSFNMDNFEIRLSLSFLNSTWYSANSIKLPNLQWDCPDPKSPTVYGVNHIQESDGIREGKQYSTNSADILSLFTWSLFSWHVSNFRGGGVTRNITCSSLDCFFLKFNPFPKHDRPYKFGEWIPKMMSLVKWYLLSIIASLVGGFNPFEKY